MIPFSRNIPPTPPPPSEGTTLQQLALAQRPANDQNRDTLRYLQGYHERRVQVKDQDGNPMWVTALVKLEAPATADSSDYDFKLTDAGGASGTTGSVLVANGYVQDSDLSDFTSTPQDPLPAKLIYQRAITGTTVAVTDGQKVYLRYTITSYNYYKYQMLVAPGNALGPPTPGPPDPPTSYATPSGMYTDANGKLFNQAGVDFVAVTGAPPDSATVGHIYLATIAISGGVMSITGQFPRHHVAPMYIVPCDEDPIP